MSGHDGLERRARATALATCMAIMEAGRGVSANERLRALELYRELGGGDSDAALALYSEIAAMTDAELEHELRGFMTAAAYCAKCSCGET